MKKLKASDYSNAALRKAYEKKWDVLQALYSTYVANNEPVSFEVSLSSLLVKNRPASMISSILEGLGREGCFTIDIFEDTVKIVDIETTKFKEMYKNVGREYKKFATVYQNSHPAQSDALDYSNPVPSYDKDKHQIKFLGKVIPIKRDSQQDELCILLLMNKTFMKKKRHMDELLEKVGASDNRKKQTSLYRAGVGINENVSKVTSVKDLIITSSKYLRVNPKYLKY